MYGPAREEVEALRPIRAAVPRSTRLRLAAENIRLPAAYAANAGSGSGILIRQVSSHVSLLDSGDSPGMGDYDGNRPRARDR